LIGGTARTMDVRPKIRGQTYKAPESPTSASKSIFRVVKTRMAVGEKSEKRPRDEAEGLPRIKEEKIKGEKRERWYDNEMCTYCLG
jgi:hypothetical protein